MEGQEVVMALRSAARSSPLLALAALLPALEQLPEGASGIAARYPADAGIAADPAVVFAEDFESVGSVADLWSRWSNVYQQHLTTVTTAGADVFAGARSLQFRIPQGTVEVANSLEKRLATPVD